LVALAEAIPRRHTNRLPFAPTVVPTQILDQLAEAARSEGAMLRTADPAERRVVLHLLSAAAERLGARGIHRADSTVRARASRRHTGLPRQALGLWEALEALPLRDIGLRQPELRELNDPDLPFPTIVILSTGRDSTSDWVASGQALQRVLLVATVHGLAATPMSQPLEDPELRAVLAGSGEARWAQLILRLGYAPPTVPASRRPLAEVLLR
jgi:nitroreductase